MASAEGIHPWQPLDPKQPMSGSLIRALNHPLRRRLLRALHRTEGARSATQLRTTVHSTVASVDYHLKVLAATEAAAKSGQRRVRGAREIFFVSKVAEHQQMLAILADTEREDERAGA